MLRILCVLPLLACTALATAAQFNPRISDRDIALNDSVRVTFSTMRPQRPEVDIRSTVNGALTLPGVREHWRVIGEPEVVQHEKVKDISVTMVLAPRHAGTLALPDIPIRWLDGDRIAEFATVDVADHIQVGKTEKPLPPELQAIGGYEWGIGAEAILAIDSRNRIDAERDGSTVILTPGGLQLVLIEDQLTEAILTVADLSLERAGSSFVERWGVAHERPDGSLHWIVGWLEIVAEPAGNGSRLRFAHEGVRSTAIAAKVANDVFDVLEGAAPDDSAPESKTNEETVGETAMPPGTTNAEERPAESAGPTDAEIKAEFERRVRELEGE